ncbi:MAG: hypothetical protein COA90_07395 [Gammaproteobacteria bacterium]|nr:MAG: hypothetical protein COA90_07395 [Gammaproteobacteria bacterium]
MKTGLFIASLLLALSTQLNAAGINLVVNGSFENPDIAAGSWSVHQAINGWSTSGSGVEVRDNVAGTAYDGSQFVELDSHSNSGIYQNFTTGLGQAYLLSFAYSPRINVASNSNKIKVLWNGRRVDTVTAQGGSSHDWTIFEYIVYGTGLDTLGFRAVGRNDSYGGSLDKVSLSAIPIPAAAFLFAPALLGLIGIRRKARNTIT